MISTDAAEGYATVDSNFLTVAIETEISPELRQEGLARELIRRIQDFRKQADFDISDRISLVYKASPLLKEAIIAHQDYIKEETLSLETDNEDIISLIEVLESDVNVSEEVAKKDLGEKVRAVLFNLPVDIIVLR